ncbi:uncharacterized protein L969DRAFT_84858 [Mixia osmundae IAM 14324]|uniref:uncharacterized protein n=1 Tax=Mixia osmundae (strain CBS 9802 / IAM 14324 / JCM 22182 / KY 12970) TaxID=764103 RepID=UPI0004A54EE4|nr:uncharacterized protein L969DRAFT_84858 [Mixia osmundae IAM 14324]KEI41139.1 hypothetical protein L969DRAFT_84858 [Mixia osmundae IAM 14324]
MFSPVRTLLFLGLFLARHGSAQLEMPHGEDSQQYVVKCKYQALACPRETAFQSVDNQSTLGFILVRPKGEDNIVTTFFLEENVTLKGSTRDYEPDQQGIALRAERELTQGTPDLRKCCRIVFFAG